MSPQTFIDGIGPKMCKDHIVLAKTALINNCIGQGLFPDELNFQHFSPTIYLTSRTLSQIFEKHIAHQIKYYFVKTNTHVIYTSQYIAKIVFFFY